MSQVGGPHTFGAGSLPEFGDAVFISYTHVDNHSFGPDERRWVSHLHEHLSLRVEQLSGERLTVWHDSKLKGNDIFPETTMDRLAKVAVLVSVCSPPYLQSDWCRRELEGFIDAANAGQGIGVGTKSRLFKVLKTPVPLTKQPEPLVPLLGYEFYERGPDEQTFREYLLDPDPEQRWKFYARVDDLAQDIVALLNDMAASSRQEEPVGSTEGATVFLAQATSDVAGSRDSLKRELERRGHLVVPDQQLPLTIQELSDSVGLALSRSVLSIHLLGARYGIRPEGDERSIPHIQVDLARELAMQDGATQQLIWIADELGAPEVAQARLLDQLQAIDAGNEVEVVRSPAEAFMAYVLDRLTPSSTPRPTIGSGASEQAKRVYLLYDHGDRHLAALLQAELEDSRHVVILPLGEGSEAEIREVHEMAMVTSDAVLIVYGSATEHWVRMKLFDQVKARGWGRIEPFLATAVWLADPITVHKRSHVTNEALVLDGSRGDVGSVLEPFNAQLASEP